MLTKQSTPYAPLLIESMRSLGYSFETAIADLIDNSISASAKKINIMVEPSDNPQLIILDNGEGMDSSALEEALRFGSHDPLDIRRDNDLGRFGLGLKSASLSQCRRLIIASKQNGTIACFSWDLDKVHETNDWSILQYSDDEIQKLPSIDLLDNVESGTYVLLQNFDRIKSASTNVSNVLKKLLDTTYDHIALVFHRIISEDGVEIFINDRLIEARDPFLENHKSTQRLREQRITVDNSTIKLQPYILPHRNKLTNEDLKMVGGSDDLRTHQGFYIYRCKRLIVWGTWFRLLNKEELNKLARVKVDIPNSLDEIWSIDVKKSSANLPDKIRKTLYGSIKDTVFGSKKVIEYRGKLNRDEEISYIWERTASRDGGVEYNINRNIPQILILNKNLNDNTQRVLESLIQSIENNFPASSVYLDIAVGEINETSEDEDKMISEINDQLECAEMLGFSKKEFVAVLLKTEPYCKYESLKKKLQIKWGISSE